MGRDSTMSPPPSILVIPQNHSEYRSIPPSGITWLTTSPRPEMNPAHWWLDLRAHTNLHAEVPISGALISPNQPYPHHLRDVAVYAATGATIAEIVTNARTLSTQSFPFALCFPDHLPVDDSILATGLLLSEVHPRALFFANSPGPRLGRAILRSLDIIRNGVDVIACPTCGRCRQNMTPIAAAIVSQTQDLDAPLTVAIMGCEVNGPGEARHADVGLAATPRGGVLFRKGKIVERLPPERMIDGLLELIMTLAKEYRHD